MLHWNTSHKIRGIAAPNSTHMFTVDSNVYILFVSGSKGFDNLQMFVFKPEVGELQKIRRPLFDFDISVIHSIACSDGKVYIWLTPYDTGRKVLYSLNMETMKTEHIVNLSSVRDKIISTAILGDMMYVLTGGSPWIRRNDLIYVIDLKTEKVAENYVLQTPVLQDNEYRRYLLAKDNKLYIMYRSGDERIVAIVENKRTVELNTDYCSPVEHRNVEVGNLWMDNSAFAKKSLIRRERCWTLDTFDFQELRWFSQNIDPLSFTSFDQPILASLKLNGRIYAVFMNINLWSTLEMRVMEIIPKLSLICQAKINQLTMKDTTEVQNHKRVKSPIDLSWHADSDS